MQRYRTSYIIVFLGILKLSYQVVIHDLTSKNFEEKVLSSKDLWMIYTCDPQQKKCKDFDITWKDVAQHYDKNMHAGYFNLSDPSAKEKAQQLGILKEGVPHIIVVFGSDGDTKTIMRGVQVKSKTDILSTIYNDMVNKELLFASGKDKKGKWQRQISKVDMKKDKSKQQQKKYDDKEKTQENNDNKSKNKGKNEKEDL